VDYFGPLLLEPPGYLDYLFGLAVSAAAARVESHQLDTVIIFELPGLIRHRRETVPARTPFTGLIAAYYPYFHRA